MSEIPTLIHLQLLLHLLPLCPDHYILDPASYPDVAFRASMLFIGILDNDSYFLLSTPALHTLSLFKAIYH